MRNIAFLIAIGASVCAAQNGRGLSEILGFENSQPDSCPRGWACSPGVVADNQVAHSGKWSVRIARDADSEPAFWTVTKGLPADFTGQTLELRGYIRSEEVKNFSGFWLREDGPSGTIAFTSMQQTNPVKGTTPWTSYSISLPLRPGAKRIFFGFLLDGPGKAWADDLELLVDGKPVDDAPKIPPPPTALDRDHEFDSGSRISISALSPLQVQNLAVLAKVWGFVKYYDSRITTGTRQLATQKQAN